MTTNTETTKLSGREWVAQKFCDIYWRDTEQTDWTHLTYFQCGFPSFPRRSKESKYFRTHNQNLSGGAFWMRWGHISWRGIKTTYKNIHYFRSLEIIGFQLLFKDKSTCCESYLRNLNMHFEVHFSPKYLDFWDADFSFPVSYFTFVKLSTNSNFRLKYLLRRTAQRKIVENAWNINLSCWKSIIQHTEISGNINQSPIFYWKVAYCEATSLWYLVLCC